MQIQRNITRIYTFLAPCYFFAKKKVKQTSNSVQQKVSKLGRPSNTLKMGIVGLTNVGKSSLFNLLSKLKVPVANKLFCTIDPNIAQVKIPDKKFEYLCKLMKPKSEFSAQLQIVDIAGLIRGASQGEGLGNEFLSHIRAVDGLYQVVRSFPKKEIIHAEGDVDSYRDMNIILDELIAKDLQFIHKSRLLLERKKKNMPAFDYDQQIGTVNELTQLLHQKKWIRFEKWHDYQIEIINKLQLLTAKPIIFLINMSQEHYLQQNCPNIKEIQEWVKNFGGDSQIINFSVEYEEWLEKNPGKNEKSELNNITQSGYKILDLIHFYTIGFDEVRSWTIRNGTSIQKAAGNIHSDFEKGFISADIISFEEFQKLGDKGLEKYLSKAEKKGKGYQVKNGDIAYIKCKIVR